MSDKNAYEEKLETRVDDIKFLLDYIEQQPDIFERIEEIDLDTIVLIGHSFGGATVLEAAKDSRITHVISLDPWMLPISDQISSKNFKLSQPICIINSDSFH